MFKIERLGTRAKAKSRRVMFIIEQITPVHAARVTGQTSLLQQFVGVADVDNVHGLLNLFDNVQDVYRHNDERYL